MKSEKYREMSRYLSGEMGPAEEVAFIKEMEGDPESLQELGQMEKTWKWYDRHFTGSKNDPSHAWNRLRNRLDQDGLLEEKEPGRDQVFVSVSRRWAAAILLIIALGVPALYFGVLNPNKEESPLSHYAEKGVKTVDLPDGSRVYLNEGSGLTCPMDFNQNRNIQLEGEAFFEVMSDPVNPFTVRSGKVVVSVLGTSFNVKKAGSADDVEVFVTSGRVRVGRRDSPKYMTLEKGDMAMIGNGGIEKKPAIDPNYISWKTKEFKFVDTQLTEVLDELEESYHVQIFAEEYLTADLRITTSYREQSIDAILETIATAFGLTVDYGDEAFFLTQ